MAILLRGLFLFLLWPNLLQSPISVAAMEPPLIPAKFAGMEPEKIWEQANELYRNSDLENALQGYLYLAQLGIQNGYLFYNLGNTFFRLGQTGKAVLWYERAVEYLPRSGDLKFNLKYARNKLSDEEYQVPEHGGTIGFLIRLHNSFNLAESLWITLGWFWGWSLCLLIPMLTRTERWKARLRIPCWSLGIAFILSSLSTGLKTHQYEWVSEAIVMDSAVEVKTGPGKDFSTSFSLHEGTKVRIVQRQGDWSRLILPGNTTFTGWIPDRAIEMIRLPTP